ncbi:hypothetical protein JNW89_14650 [Micromonospora sp. 4G55]|nr:hypothetical protein [Micromonospora sp. 4G55]
MPKPRVTCQAATAQPAPAQPGRTRSGRYPWRSDQPWPRASMASARATPPMPSTCRCPAWASFHGAYANDAPATAAPARPAPNCRDSA